MRQIIIIVLLGCIGNTMYHILDEIKITNKLLQSRLK